MKTRSDIRSEQTDGKIISAFLTLVDIKGYENVTVSSIAQKAGINRNTFYLHYDGKEDLIVCIFKKISEKIMSVMRSKCSIQENLRNIILAMCEHRDLYRVLLSTDSLTGFYMKAKKDVFSMVEDYIADKLGNDRVKAEFIIGGVAAVIENGIIHDDETVDVITHGCMRLILACMRVKNDSDN